MASISKNTVNKKTPKDAVVNVRLPQELRKSIIKRNAAMTLADGINRNISNGIIELLHRGLQSEREATK